MKENIVQDKSYKFAIRIIELFRKLSTSESVLARQMLRSGTSIGANVEEAIGAQTRQDFFSKMTIAYKEARETRYWIRLLIDSNLVDAEKGSEIKNDCEELLRIIGSIQKTIREGNGAG
jgi:four helix bundle protein